MIYMLVRHNRRERNLSVNVVDNHRAVAQLVLLPALGSQFGFIAARQDTQTTSVNRDKMQR